MSTGTRSRLTFAGADAFIPVWSPDGSRILFSSFRDGPSNLYQRPASGAGADEPVHVSSDQKFAHDWSPDGFVAYMQSNALEDYDVLARRVDGSGSPVNIGRSVENDFYPRFSSDGRWNVVRIG